MTNENKLLDGKKRLYKFMQEIREVNFKKDKSANIGGAPVKYLTIQSLLKEAFTIAHKHNIYIEFKQEDNTHYIRFTDMETGEALTEWSRKEFVHQSHTLNKYGKPTMSDAQLNGAEQTYTIRYHLFLVLGVFPDEDTDANLHNDNNKTYNNKTYNNKTYNNISEDNKIADYNINTKNNEINELIKKYNDLYDRCTSLKIKLKFQKLSCDKLLSFLNINDINDINEKHIADIKTQLDKGIYIMESQLVYLVKLNEKNGIQIKEPISNFINNGNGMRKIGE